MSSITYIEGQQFVWGGQGGYQVVVLEVRKNGSALLSNGRVVRKNRMSMGWGYWGAKTLPDGRVVQRRSLDCQGGVVHPDYVEWLGGRSFRIKPFPLSLDPRYADYRDKAPADITQEEIERFEAWKADHLAWLAECAAEREAAP